MVVAVVTAVGRTLVCKRQVNHRPHVPAWCVGIRCLVHEDNNDNDDDDKHNDDGGCGCGDGYHALSYRSGPYVTYPAT